MPIVIELNDLADEEESAFNSRPVGSQWSVSGQDSNQAFEEMKAAADKISMEIEELRGVSEARPKFQSG